MSDQKSDDELAQKQRAERLQQQIEAFTSGHTPESPRSPRQFIEQKMREEAAKQTKKPRKKSQ
ncbi:hypothetical protein GC163_23690 [bacterium]|nr:hypothetical protein [bacterium]